MTNKVAMTPPSKIIKNGITFLIMQDSLLLFILIITSIFIFEYIIFDNIPFALYNMKNNELL